MVEVEGSQIVAFSLSAYANRLEKLKRLALSHCSICMPKIRGFILNDKVNWLVAAVVILCILILFPYFVSLSSKQPDNDLPFTASEKKATGANDLSNDLDNLLGAPNGGAHR